MILMLSTTVSIAGNVQRIFSTGTPTSNGAYRFGSNVSGAAMPPAIQSRMQVSAVAFGCSIFQNPSRRRDRLWPIKRERGQRRRGHRLQRNSRRQAILCICNFALMIGILIR